MAKCKDKKRYGTLKNAERGRMNLWGADPHADLSDLHVYKCPECGFFHVGHKSKYRGEENVNQNLDERILSSIIKGENDQGSGN